MAGATVGELPTAVAQVTPSPPLRSPLTGVAQPGTGPADGAEPWAVTVNPAGLGEAAGWLFGLVHSELVGSDRGGVSGRGTGLFVATPLPYISRLVVGGGLELLRPDAGPAEPGLVPMSGKLSLALAYHLGSRQPGGSYSVNLGLGYAHLFSRGESPTPDGLDTVTLSAHARLGQVGRYLSAGLVLHDLSAPVPRDAALPPLQRSYELELLGRPLGDHRFELAAGLRVAETTRDLYPRLRLWVRPTRGLGLGAEALVAYRPGQATPPDYRVGLGLQIDFAHAGANLFGLLGSGGLGGSGSAPGFAGLSAAVRGSVERYPSLAHRQRPGSASGVGGGRLYRVALGGSSGEATLQLLADLRAVETDRTARGIVVVMNHTPGGWGLADELRAAFLRLRERGKRVFVYGAELKMRDYYVASAADRIFLDPLGVVHLVGVSQGSFYLKEALDRFGIRADLVRVGEYKAAPETFTRNEPSEPARAQRQALIDDLFERLVAGIAATRRLAPQALRDLTERGGLTAKAALAEKLVDGVGTTEALEALLEKELGATPQVSLLPPAVDERPRGAAEPGIAVVQVDGDITEGRSRRVPLVDLRFAGGESLLGALSEAQRDPRVRAVVVRVNSPGGSALVADLLARQIEEVARDKPVICSFGDTAASGGYYLAAPCSLIFANPSTVTGSIGIFGGKVDISGLLGLVGVKRVTIARGSTADQDSYYRPYTDGERLSVLERLQQGYDRFLEVVARGRRMTLPAVDAVARGRIHSGEQALKLRLVDQSGGFMDAVAEARRRAGLPDEPGPLFFYPQKQPSLLTTLLGLPPDLVGASASAVDPTGDLARLLGLSTELLLPLRAALLLSEGPVQALMLAPEL